MKILVQSYATQSADKIKSQIVLKIVDLSLRDMSADLRMKFVFYFCSYYCGIKWLKPCFPPQSHFLQHLVFQSLNGLLLVQELWSVRVFRVNYFEHVRNPAVVSALVCLIWAHRNNQRAIVLGCGAKQLDLSGNKFVLPIVHIQIRPTPPKCCHFCNVCFCWTMSAFYKYEYAKLHGAPADKSCR